MQLPISRRKTIRCRRKRWVSNPFSKHEYNQSIPTCSASNLHPADSPTRWGVVGYDDIMPHVRLQVCVLDIRGNKSEEKIDIFPVHEFSRPLRLLKTQRILNIKK